MDTEVDTGRPARMVVFEVALEGRTAQCYSMVEKDKQNLATSCSFIIFL